MRRRVILRGALGFFLLAGILLLGAGAARALFDSGIFLTADDPMEKAQFGRSVAVDGNTAVVGAPEGDNETDPFAPGAAYVFKRVGKTYVQEARLEAPDPELGAEFGRAVAIKGNVIVVGARFASSGAVARAGAAYVFRKIGWKWVYEQKLTSADSSPEDNFGRAVALEDNLLVVTARKEDASSPDVGAAYVFHRKGRTWKQEAKLTSSDPNPAALFGQSAAVQGNLIVIGARDADTPAAKGAGALYLFAWVPWIPSKWVEFDKLYASDGKSGDQFAFNITVYGNIIASGARRADLTDPDRKDSGAVYLFGLYGWEWKEIQKLTASDARAGDEFGHSVAMSDNIIAVGARRADIDGNTDQGAVYIFRRLDDHGHFGKHKIAEWEEEAKITAFNGAAGDEFGHSLAADDHTIVVGATGVDFMEADQGAGYVYRLWK